MGVEAEQTDYLQTLCVLSVLFLYIYLATHELTHMFFFVKVIVLLACKSIYHRISIFFHPVTIHICLS